MTTESPRKKRARRQEMCITLVLVMSCIGLVFYMRGLLIAKYDRGIELMQNGDYEAAYQIFSSMTNYHVGGRDADAMAAITKCRMDQNEAITRIESGDYVEALHLLMGLDYNDPNIARLINDCCRAIADNPLETVETAG